MKDILKELDTIASSLENKGLFSEAATLHNIFIKIAGLPTNEKPNGHKSPPKGYPEKRTEYADPKNFKYPLNTKERCVAAWRYIHESKNHKGYSSDEISSMESKIKGVAKRDFGLNLAD